jgi:acyl carrier protein
MSDPTFDIVRAALVDLLGVPPERIGPATLFVEDLEMDSLLSVALLSTLVEQLDLRIDPMETVGVESVGQLVALLAWKLEERS